MDTKIEIKNVGPIKEAKFTLNKINVFMGQQSSGKSIINYNFSQSPENVSTSTSL
jgi:predicted ATPase